MHSKVRHINKLSGKLKYISLRVIVLEKLLT